MADAIDRLGAQEHARAVVREIGMVLAKAPHLTDEKCFEIMEKILTEAFLEGRPCPTCTASPFTQSD